MNTLIILLLNSLAVLLASYFVPGVVVTGFTSAVLVSLVLGVLNVFVKPILVFITLPINILTLGLFTLVINTFLIMIVSSVVPGFAVSDFLHALLFSLVLSIVLTLIHSLA